jgi:RNA polymerase sigma-70 factor (ECF subfamily)
MLAVTRGDPDAFERLYLRLSPWLHRLMALQLPQPDLAGDLVQQAFLQLHLARQEFRAGARLRPWLVTIALNLKRGYFRRRKRRAETSVEEALEGQPDTEAESPEQAAEAARVRQAVRRLPAHEQEVIVLHYFGGFSYGEIESLTGTGRSAIKQRARRGYERLRAELADDSR